jgi:hypothetical protein
MFAPILVGSLRIFGVDVVAGLLYFIGFRGIVMRLAARLIGAVLITKGWRAIGWQRVIYRIENENKNVSVAFVELKVDGYRPTRQFNLKIRHANYQTFCCLPK